MVQEESYPFPHSYFFNFRFEKQELRVSVRKGESNGLVARPYRVCVQPTRHGRNRLNSEVAAQDFTFCLSHQNCCGPEEKVFCLQAGSRAVLKSDCRHLYCNVIHRDCCGHTRKCDVHHALCEGRIKGVDKYLCLACFNYRSCCPYPNFVTLDISKPFFPQIELLNPTQYDI